MFPCISHLEVIMTPVCSEHWFMRLSTYTHTIALRIVHLVGRFHQSSERIASMEFFCSFHVRIRDGHVGDRQCRSARSGLHPIAMLHGMSYWSTSIYKTALEVETASHPWTDGAIWTPSSCDSPSAWVCVRFNTWWIVRLQGGPIDPASGVISQSSCSKSVCDNHRTG